jgi:hypothetical protein
MRCSPVLLVACAGFIGGCRSVDEPATPDAPATAIDATHDAYIGSKSAPCSSTFGNAITQAFGRLDGTIHAVIPPDDQHCAMSNQTHLQIEVESGGREYRMFVNVQSDQGPPDVYVKELDAPLPGLAWADGWHPGLLFDYIAQLGLHSTDFTQVTTALLVPQITDELILGDRISVYASSSNNNSDSAHLVHRNPTNHDGGIVLHPDGASPHWITVRFDEQVF